MMHPYLKKGMTALLIVSGTIFAFLSMLTVAGMVLIGMNGGVV